MKYNDKNLNLPIGIPIQNGKIDNISGIQKFGYNSSVSTSFETIWDNGDLYNYPTTATTAVATSDNTGDDNNGTVHVFGLDANYDLIDEVITIGGSASTALFIRVFRAYMQTGETDNVNQGNITITVNSIAVAKITAGYGQTLMSVYTIPRNYRGFLMSFDAGTSKQKEVELKIMVRPINGNTFQTKAFLTTFGVPIRKEYLIPEILIEKTDIEVRAKADAATAISAGFELILQDITLGI